LIAKDLTRPDLLRLSPEKRVGSKMVVIDTL